MRFFYLLALLSAYCLVYASGDKISDTRVMEISPAVNTDGKDQKDSVIPEQINLLEKSVEKTGKDIKKAEEDMKDLTTKADNSPHPEKETQPRTSEDDKRARNSPIFTPGGAPRPVPREKLAVNSSKFSKDNGKDSDQDKTDGAENTTTENNTNATSDTGTTSSLPNLNNNYNNPTYPPSSSTGYITLKAAITPSGGEYQYTIAREAVAVVNPFQGVDANNLKLTVNGPIYTKIAFCNDRDYTNCGEAKALPWTIAATPEGAKIGKVTKSINNENFKVPSISAQLTKTDGSTQNVQLLFYNTSLSCTKKKADNNLLCTIPKSGASFEIQKI